MNTLTKAFLLSAAVGFFVPMAFAATPPQVVNIRLQDSGESTMAAMHIAVDVERVKAGRVSFAAVNESKNLVHELVVVGAPAPGKALPYDEKKQEVIESRIRKLGEISDIKPGASGKLTLNLKPGSYLLICNQSGHYKAGMSSALVVEK